MKHFSFLAIFLALFIAFPAHAWIDGFPPTVGDVTANADPQISGSYVTYSVTATDNVAVAGCQLFIDNAEVGDMVALGLAPYQMSYHWPWSAVDTDHTAFARCADTYGNFKSSTGTTIFVVKAGTDTANPVVGAVTPATAVAGVPVTFSALFSDTQSGVVQCSLYLNGTKVWTSATGTASLTGAVAVTRTLSAGTNNLTVMCIDAAGNSGSGPQTAVVTASSGDTTPPNTGVVTPSVDQPQAGTTVKYSVTATDNVGIVNCHLLVDGEDVGNMPFVSSSTYAMNLTWASSTSDIVHSARAQCSDAAGNSSTSVNLIQFHVTPSNSSSNSTVSITKSTVVADPMTATANGTQTVTITVRLLNDSNTPLAGKTVTVSAGTGGATISSPVATNQNGEATFAVRSSYAGYVTIVATADNQVITQQPVIHFITNTCPSVVGQLIKLKDDGDPKTTEDTAVYYYGSDCKRHAFPNERVYMTWYSNFNQVSSISASLMSGIPLGSNVTYRPGVKMVKFTTLNKVYAVTRGGVLRWVTTEALARQFYGSAWNKYIDDISDVFYGNYKFGNDISASGDYSPSNETSNAPTVDYSL
ncbi:MAG: Ig-like domain-containing protein [Patescibacteria group bacterium]